MKKSIYIILKSIFIIFICSQILFCVGCEKKITEDDLVSILNEISQDMQDDELPGVVEASINHEEMLVEVYINENHPDKDETVDRIKNKYGDNVRILVGEYHTILL